MYDSGGGHYAWFGVSQIDDTDCLFTWETDDLDHALVAKAERAAEQAELARLRECKARGEEVYWIKPRFEHPRIPAEDCKFCVSEVNRGLHSHLLRNAAAIKGETTSEILHLLRKFVPDKEVWRTFDDTVPLRRAQYVLLQGGGGFYLAFSNRHWMSGDLWIDPASMIVRLGLNVDDRLGDPLGWIDAVRRDETWTHATSLAR